MYKRIELVRQFQPLRENSTYGMDRLVDMAAFPLAEAITIYAIADSNVGGSPIRVQVVGNDSPDPGGGVVTIHVEEIHLTTPDKYSKVVLSIEIAKAAFPFYGVLFHTGATAPSKGFCWAYADIWWPGG